MELSLSIATKLLDLLKGERVPASSLKQEVILRMIEEGVVQKIQSSKSRAVLFVPDKEGLRAYLRNHFSIPDLDLYITKYKEEEFSRSEAVAISGNSKLRAVRTFTGFPINVYEPVEALMNGKPFGVQPQEGMFSFVHDYKGFVPHESVTIVGVENAESFRLIHRQQYLFEGIKPLFVCRYPQSNDLVHWLKGIPNKYLHFGDLDFEGIAIYLNEYKRHLGERTSFFIPIDSIRLLQEHGNRDLYDKQLGRTSLEGVEEQGVNELISAFHKYKRVLEQEIFIKWLI